MSQSIAFGQITACLSSFFGARSCLSTLIIFRTQNLSGQIILSSPSYLGACSCMRGVCRSRTAFSSFPCPRDQDSKVTCLIVSGFEHEAGHRTSQRRFFMLHMSHDSRFFSYKRCIVMEEERSGGGKSRVYISNFDGNIGKAAANLLMRKTYVLIKAVFERGEEISEGGRRARYHGPQSSIFKVCCTA
jgi:hypothetical protein